MCIRDRWKMVKGRHDFIMQCNLIFTSSLSIKKITRILQYCWFYLSGIGSTGIAIVIVICYIVLFYLLGVFAVLRVLTWLTLRNTRFASNFCFKLKDSLVETHWMLWWSSFQPLRISGRCKHCTEGQEFVQYYRCCLLYTSGKVYKQFLNDSKLN